MTSTSALLSFGGMALRDDIEEANALLDVGHGSVSHEPRISTSADQIHADVHIRVTTPVERRRAFTILFISLTCMGAGQTVLFNILPPLSRQLGLSAIETTGIFSVSALIWVITSAYWGAKSDRWGRKPIMLMGLFSFAISFALFATVILAGLRHWLPVVAIFPLLIATRSVYGLLGSGTAPASQAYVADRTTAKERLSGVATIGSAFGVGTVVGPGIASVFAVIGLLAPFYFIVLLALVSAVAIWLLLPERTAPRQREHVAWSLKWYDRRILPFVLFAIGLSIANTVPIQTMGFFFIDVLRIRPEAAAQFILVGQMASSMSALFAQLVVVQRFPFSARQLTNWGLAAAFVSLVVFLLTGHFGPLVFALALSGLGFGMARPGFVSGASLAVEPHEQGAVAGIIGGASATGFIFGPVIGWMYERSPYVPYWFGAIMIVLLFIAMFVSPTLRHAGAEAPEPEAAEEAAETPLANG